MKQAKLENMPKELRDAYLKLAPYPEQLPTFFDKSAKRMREFKDWPAEVIRAIKAPTLVIVGDADNIRPEHAVEMFRLLQHAQLAVLPGGHGTSIGEVTAARFDGSQVKFGVGDSKASKLPDLVAAMIGEFLDAPMPEPKKKRAAIAPEKPEDWPRLFTQHLNAGDLEAVMALYEADARFVTRSGETLVGREGTVALGNVALLYTDFEGTTVDVSGKTVDARYKAIEVLRRQGDGTWQLIVGDPNGRE